MGCPPVRGDNPRALASGLSYVHVDKHGIIYTTYISVDLAYHEMFRAKLGKGGIKLVVPALSIFPLFMTIVAWSQVCPWTLMAYIANSMDTDQTARLGAVWSGFILFASIIKLDRNAFEYIHQT